MLPETRERLRKTRLRQLANKANIVFTSAKQKMFLNSKAKRKTLLAGHAFGKTYILLVSTSTRTRLYQIAIGKVYDPQKSDLIIYGEKNGVWMNFEPNVSFDGFLIMKKS